MSSNLSELSVQLRKLQADKIAQANEIDRLGRSLLVHLYVVLVLLTSCLLKERQVRILSELKGIGITDLQDALRLACEAEAHGELQNLVGKLQARVDGLQLGVSGGVGGLRRAKGGEQFNEEAAARGRSKLVCVTFMLLLQLVSTNISLKMLSECIYDIKAVLELKIGQLQEIEKTLRMELTALYNNCKQLTEKNTVLETQLAQWQRCWQAKEEEEKKRNSIVPMAMPSSPGSYNYSEFATNNGGESSQQALLNNVPQSELSSEQRLIVAESSLVGEKQQRNLLESQLSSASKQYELKREQYEHRIQYLEEQLHDLNQQMSSLYAAFEIQDHDNRLERHEKEVWKRTVVESDSLMAKQSNRESTQQSNLQNSSSSNDAEPLRARRSLRLLSPSNPRPESIPPRAAVRPAAHPPICKGILLLLLDKDDQALSSTPSPAATPRTKSFSARKLLPKSSSKSKRQMNAATLTSFKFKRQYCVLHGANGLYQIRYGDSYDGPTSGVHEFLTAGVSSIEHTSRSSSQEFGFEIMINPNDSEAPALCCAAESEEGFMMWMSSLTSVIDGSLNNKTENVDEHTSTEIEAYAEGVSPAI